MSNRLYPLYQRGNPQLRSFLTNFNVFPVRPTVQQPPNVVTFHCSMKMTVHDIKNYLIKIYKLPVEHVRMDIEMGETRKVQSANYVVKDEDVKVAYVTLGNNETFQFPDLFPSDVDEDLRSNKDMETAKQEYRRSIVTQNVDFNPRRCITFPAVPAPAHQGRPHLERPHQERPHQEHSHKRRPQQHNRHDQQEGDADAAGDVCHKMMLGNMKTLFFLET
ncbi:Ribosomal protein L25/L23 [Trinorchestia longiramus]|nr:Ribosomal protein L25/L23 [Trinorchestia longiramus]